MYYTGSTFLIRRFIVAPNKLPEMHPDKNILILLEIANSISHETHHRLKINQPDQIITGE